MGLGKLENISTLTTKEITFYLLKLATAGLLIGSVFVAPGLGILVKYFPDSDHKDKQRIKRNLRKLYTKGLIRYDSNNLETKVVLTTDGEVYMNEQMLFDLELKIPSTWNHKWFVVMFDIPTRRSDKVRHLLRTKLLELGFVAYQDSVYVFPYYCRSLINDIEKILNIKNCIQTMIVEKLDGEEPLKRHFNLT